VPGRAQAPSARGDGHEDEVAFPGISGLVLAAVIAAPAVASKDAGGIRNQFHHVIDIVPTILEAAGLPEPEMVNGIAQKPIEAPAWSALGTSFHASPRRSAGRSIDPYIRPGSGMPSRARRRDISCRKIRAIASLRLRTASSGSWRIGWRW
jgi:hypothetical protein